MVNGHRVAVNIPATEHVGQQQEPHHCKNNTWTTCGSNGAMKLCQTRTGNRTKG